MIAATTLEFIKDLVQYEHEGQFFDFHNDYSCERLSFVNDTFTLRMRHSANGSYASITFSGVQFTTINVYQSNERGSLTLDMLYRGRFQTNEQLIDISEDGKGYFYLEFYEGHHFEFWAESIDWTIE